jgi:hypothetical protein
MTEGGASSESDRLRAGSEVSSLKGLDWLDWLAGLTMSSVFGDLMSFRSSWASSSISVWSVALVPLLSTGDGSTVAGYGLGGGTRWSECVEDLFEKTWLKFAGELGESV